MNPRESEPAPGNVEDSSRLDAALQQLGEVLSEIATNSPCIGSEVESTKGHLCEPGSESKEDTMVTRPDDDR